MGIFVITCQGCNKVFQWFSGSSDQFCSECKEPKGNPVNMENKEIQHLNQIIELQKEVINLLKEQIQRLKIANTYPAPYLTNPSPVIAPGSPVSPFIQPLDPIHPFQQPSYPGINPFVVTCGDPAAIGSGGTTSSGVIDTSKVT